MVLIVLFLLSTVFLLIHIEPFTITGIFLSLCYLPGLVVFSLLKKDRLLFEDMILAFPCSIGLSSAAVLAMLSIGVQIDVIPIIMHILIGIITALYFIVRSRKKDYIALEINKQEWLFCLFGLISVLLLSIPYFIGPNRLSIAGHVFHHSVMVTQILNGIFPPENPGLGGTAIGYYWGFHVLIAAITTKTHFHQVQVIFILNALSLYVIFCVAYRFARAFNIPEKYVYIMPLAVIGLIRVDTGILLLKKLLSGSLPTFESITAYPIEPIDVLKAWLQGLSWFDTRLLFTSKFYNISGMPLAICLCFSYLMMLLLCLKKEMTEKKICFINIGSIIAGCIFNYPPLAIFPLLHAPLWAAYIFVSSGGHFKERLKEALNIILPYVTAVVLVLPYLLVIIKSRGISSGSQGEIFTLDFYYQSLRNMIVFLIPFPLIVAGAWIAFKKFYRSGEFFFLCIGGTLGLILIAFTRWPFDNSYKFDYVLILFFAILFILALATWLPLIMNRLLRFFTATMVVSALLATPLIEEASYIVAAFSADNSYAFSDKHIIFARNSKKNEAYSWIRDHTPLHALLMLSYVETSWPRSGMNPNYEPAALTERTLYVIKDEDYTTSNSEYERRILFREKVFKDPEGPSVIGYFSGLNRAVYLLVEDDLDEKKFFVDKRFKDFPVNPGKPFVLKFKNDKQRVYLIDINK